MVDKNTMEEFYEAIDQLDGQQAIEFLKWLHENYYRPTILTYRKWESYL